MALVSSRMTQASRVTARRQSMRVGKTDGWNVQSYLGGRVGGSEIAESVSLMSKPGKRDVGSASK